MLMMLALDVKESSLLQQVLESYLSDLRMEIAETESHDMRESLKDDEATIKRLIARLTSAQVGAS